MESAPDCRAAFERHVAVGSPWPALIPLQVVGAIIGKGGSKIREIRQLSQAQIKIADNIPGTTERMITMSGTPEAVQMAHYLIQTRMQEAVMANAMGTQVP